MNMNDIIIKKREHQILTEEEITYFVQGYTEGNIPDYQVSALLMAICLNGMTEEETIILTKAMKESGDLVDLSSIQGITVDKHSTGGVGDKTTLIAAPIAAACGVPIAKMSGRGLGFTGGTIDKLESIPGFQTTLEAEAFMKQVNEIGLAVIGQSGHIAPADKKIYALRDVTGTVENLSLITSSIMSKKLAAGSDAIVLDVKCGNGAFMKTEEDAEALARLMVKIGKADGKRTIAVVTDMNQPLGRAVGNSLEVIEVIETLKGNGPKDITELSETLAGMMIYAGGKADSPEVGMVMAHQVLSNGKALQKFKEFVKGQNGDDSITEDYSKLPQHSIVMQAVSPRSGYVSAIHAEKIGAASQHTGAGRATKEETIDLTAGIYLDKKVGDYVEAGEILAEIYGTQKEKVALGAAEAAEAYVITDKPPKQTSLIKMVLK